jgi:DNA-directed RNA polymerase specialized sigma24 family protein
MNHIGEFNCWLQSQYPHLQRSIRRIIQNADDAADVAHDFIVDLLETDKWANIASHPNPKARLLREAVNAAKDWYKRGTLVVPFSACVDTPTEGTGEEDVYHQIEDILSAQQCGADAREWDVGYETYTDDAGKECRRRYIKRNAPKWGKYVPIGLEASIIEREQAQEDQFTNAFELGCALGPLPPQNREVMLRKLMGHSVEDIAQQLELRKRTVYDHLRRGYWHIAWNVLRWYEMFDTSALEEKMFFETLKKEGRNAEAWRKAREKSKGNAVALDENAFARRKSFLAKYIRHYRE